MMTRILSAKSTLWQWPYFADIKIFRFQILDRYQKLMPGPTEYFLHKFPLTFYYDQLIIIHTEVEPRKSFVHKYCVVVRPECGRVSVDCGERHSDIVSLESNLPACEIFKHRFYLGNSTNGSFLTGFPDVQLS